ncbi:type IV pilus assembly protein FimV [Vreelandella olivaria]|uniref:type IV pilus assembly protein FimV n=1 Tax=Vreelandella olivaria TaxID=390919 RepID=UPI00201EB817|nr:FimV/HubP family polar landmark protein [Halomonas olivaria]
MKNKLVWLSWLSLSAVSPLVLAIGLGPATVNSPLDAPLSATVPLLDTDHYELEDLHIEVADEAAFAALGLEWTSLVANISAQLQERSGGRHLLLGSSRAITEPWLDVLLTISSPQGEYSQAFTLLFDPPERLVANAPVADTSAGSTPTPARQDTPEAGPAQAGNVADVASGDTLWGVAQRVKPSSASVQQMMVALVEANPDAFPAGNIDSMRAGQTLTVPDSQAVLARAPSEAAQMLQAMRQPASGSSGSTAVDPVFPHVEAPLFLADSSHSEQVSSDSRAGEAEQPEMAPDSELAGLTLNDVVGQLRESQAMLQQVLDEREQLRAELAELRQEVASLTEALNVSQQAAQRAVEAAQTLAAAASATGAADVPGNARGISERMSAYRWPLASVALALLLGALVWSRKRRERQWETVPATYPPPSGAAPASASAPSAREVTPPRTEPVLDETPPIAPDHATTEEAQNNPSDEQEPEHVAVGERELGSKPMSEEEPSAPNKADAIATDEEAPAKADENEEPIEAAPEDGQGAYYIDYHPPTLNSEKSGATEPSQVPTVEFEGQGERPVQAVKRDRRIPEEEWEIEEVAFEPQRRDNS